VSVHNAYLTDHTLTGLVWKWMPDRLRKLWQQHRIRI
jgi:hypothetical protein